LSSPAADSSTGFHEKQEKASASVDRLPGTIKHLERMGTEGRVPMQPAKTPTPVPRDAPAYELDWEAVEPRHAPAATAPRDLLGLTPEDRKALGMTAPRTVDLAPFVVGDASAALQDAMARGASYGKAKRAPRSK
jgi:hypothetical protein